MRSGRPDFIEENAVEIRDPAPIRPPEESLAPRPPCWEGVQAPAFGDQVQEVPFPVQDQDSGPPPAAPSRHGNPASTGRPCRPPPGAPARRGAPGPIRRPRRVTPGDAGLTLSERPHLRALVREKDEPIRLSHGEDGNELLTRRVRIGMLHALPPGEPIHRSIG